MRKFFLTLAIYVIFFNIGYAADVRIKDLTEFDGVRGSDLVAMIMSEDSIPL